MTPILLASASPRRRELFSHMGFPFTVTSVDTDETVQPGEDADSAARRLALDKARAARPQNPHGVVVGCDTLVVIDGDILGKPKDQNEARAMLARLSGREHRVVTAFAVIFADGREVVEAPSTTVRFRPMTEAEIAAYVATGEPMDKAGAYGIQERGAVFVEGVTGDYFTVVGLPLCRLYQALVKMD
ncbi:MAG: Maf family protein [Nitrospirota bacterium]|nr:Maf family protein [Nitrospirota bacterium]